MRGARDEQTTPVTLSSLIASSFMPALVYEIGTGAVTPVMVLSASHLGASTGTAAFTGSLIGIGRVIGDVPASYVAERLGDRRSMVLAAMIAFAAFVGCLVARSLAVLDLSITVVGLTGATFYLARQAYVVEVIPPQLRARAMSTLAGSHRIGLFIGPFAGALAISIGGLRAAYVVAMCTAVATSLLLVFVKDIEPHNPVPRTAGEVSAREVLRSRGRLFATLGLVIVVVGAVRQSRQTVLPLWAQHVGLSAAQTSLVFGIASAVDMALFYPSGKVMDRWGRLAIALPAMTIMGAALLVLPLTHGIVALTLVAMTVSFGNGIGSGIMQTLGGDAAIAEGRRRFLGIWRFFGDTGQAIGPVIVSVVAGIASLAAGIVTIGCLGLASVVGLAVWVPRWTPFATPRSVRQHSYPEHRPRATRDRAAKANPVTSVTRPPSDVACREPTRE